MIAMMRNPWGLGIHGLGLLALLFASGCGPKVDEGPTRYHVSGQATYEGKAIPKGTIYFEPDNEKGNTGPQSAAPIVEGNFETPLGKGVIGGPYRVKIVGYDGIPTTVEGEPLPDGQALFPSYETTFDFPKEDSEKSFEVPKQDP